MSHPGAVIEPFEGTWPTIADDAFIAPGAVVVGDVHIGAGASVWYGCVIRGDDNAVRIGPRTNVQDGTIIHVTYQTHPTIIGTDVIIGHGARLHGCTLEDNCLVGIGAIVLDGASVGNQAMLAAGALLAPGKAVPSGQLWGGSPARHMRALSDDDRTFLEWDAGHYVRLAEKYRSSGQA